MTGRTTGILAGTGVTVVILALVARPLLPHPATTKQSRPVTAAAPPIPVSVLPAAAAAATTALACPSTPPPSRDAACGTLHVDRRQARCPTDAHCRVELVGVLHTSTVTVPVALTLTLRDTNGHWYAVEVAS